MYTADPSETVGQAVNHDVAARGNTRLLRPRPIVGIRVRDVKGTVKVAVFVAAIENVGSFRSLVIALLCLRTNRVRCPALLCIS